MQNELEYIQDDCLVWDKDPRFDEYFNNLIEKALTNDQDEFMTMIDDIVELVGCLEEKYDYYARLLED